MNDVKIYQDIKARENGILKGVYLYLILGLVVTAAVSVLVSMTKIALVVATNMFALILVAVAQIALVIYLSSRIERMSRNSAILAFLGYSALTGLTFSSILLFFSETALLKALVSAVATFAAASVYGAFSKKDVRGWGRYLTMALFGLLAASLINMFFFSSTLDLLISCAGVILFTGITVWDTNKICAMNQAFGTSVSADDMHKLSILGALDLYLDFINIFLYLLRLFARSDN